MNVIARHQNWREKRNNSRHSGFWRASYQHQTRVHTCPVRVHMHLLPWTYSMASLSKFLQCKVGSNNPDLHSTSPSYHDSGQPRLSSGSRRDSSALFVIIRQSSAVRTHIAVARAVEWMRVGDQKRDQTFRWWSEFFLKTVCANARAGDPEGFTVSCEWPPSPFYKRAVVLNVWCARRVRNILTTARVIVMQPHTHTKLDQVQTISALKLLFSYSKLNVWIITISK